MDSFYNILTPEQSKLAHQSLFNFDHPSAFDYDLLYDTLKKLKEGKSVTVPIYNFSTHSREEKTVTIYGANVIIFEGILALYDKRIRDMMDVKKAFWMPTMKFADVIIPRGLENVIAIDLMTKHIQTQLNENVINFRWNLLDTPVKEEVPNNVHVLPTTNQIKGIHTILRDHNTERDEFVFYADRLAVLLMEYAINLLPSEPLTVTTPIGAKYEGLRYSQKICGVSILRAGGTMEAGLKRVFSDAVIGKLLIQTNPNTGDPELHYCKLPNSARDHNVVLMDAMVGTGAAALMAIRVLLDHEVPEDRIIFVSFLAAQIGLTVINNAFPRVKIVTSMVDPDLNKEKLWIVPGIGNFGGTF
ncbi:PRTase-like protein [Rhizopus microsporus]|uniref:uridine/cytidine kinase n=1 Tax=Rhizopus microsporus TaxID=58291 RepID=A0A1X0SDF3_RHIZD|nr:PRTase-like protein [Rhizopus microsporus]